jgi:hypothetical protein
MTDIGNNFFNYLKNKAGTPIVFIILDNQTEKYEYIEQMEKLHSQVNFTPIIVTDIKN